MKMSNGRASGNKGGVQSILGGRDPRVHIALLKNALFANQCKAIYETQRAFFTWFGCFTFILSK